MAAASDSDTSARTPATVDESPRFPENEAERRGALRALLVEERTARCAAAGRGQTCRTAPTATRPRYDAPLLQVIEPDFMVRRTVVLVARDLDLADIHDASGSDTATPLLAGAACDGVMVCIDGNDAHALIGEMRGGGTRNAARAPIAFTMNGCGADDVHRLRDLDVDQALLPALRTHGGRVDNAV